MGWIGSNAASKLSKTFKKWALLFEIEEHIHSVGHSERSGAWLSRTCRHNGLLKCNHFADEAIKLQEG